VGGPFLETLAAGSEFHGSGFSRGEILPISWAEFGARPEVYLDPHGAHRCVGRVLDGPHEAVALRIEGEPQPDPASRRVPALRTAQVFARFLALLAVLFAAMLLAFGMLTALTLTMLPTLALLAVLTAFVMLAGLTAFTAFTGLAALISLDTRWVLSTLGGHGLRGGLLPGICPLALARTGLGLTTAGGDREQGKCHQG